MKEKPRMIEEEISSLERAVEKDMDNTLISKDTTPSIPFLPLN
ncbi:MAG TPA: hypothetical protein VFE88_00660 [Candidatus Nanoarchaeia archaeon]|nr:hypothetical protein [Candidatus Nanoarchaeia archaeon]